MLHVALAAENTDPSWGGAQRYSGELAEALSRLGLKVTLILPRGITSMPPGVGAAVLPPRKSLIPSVSFPGLLTKGLSVAKEVEILRRKLSFQILHDTDLGQCGKGEVATLQQCSPLSIAASFKSGKPYWASSTFDLAVSLVARQAMLYPVNEYIVARRYKVLIAPSEMVRRGFIEHYGVKPSKVAKIPHGVNTDRFRPDHPFRQQLRAKLGIGESDQLLCFSGWDFTRKGLFVVFKALALVREAKLLILGRRNLPPFYAQLASELGIRKRILCLSTREVESYLGASDVMVFPSLFDAFGLAALEGMAAGLPVIVSPTAGVSELISGWRDGVVLKNPLDHVEVAECVKRLLNEEHLRKDMSRRARTTSLNYSWEKVAEPLIEVYQEVSSR